MRNDPVTEEMIGQWWKLHTENKMSIRAIAKRTGYSETSVSLHLKKRREEIDHRGKTN